MREERRSTAQTMEKNRVQYSHSTLPNMLTSGNISDLTFDLLRVFLSLLPSRSLQKMAHCLQVRLPPEAPVSYLTHSFWRAVSGSLSRISNSRQFARPWTTLCVGPWGCPTGFLPPHHHKEVSKRLWQGWCTQRLTCKSSRDVRDKLSFSWLQNDQRGFHFTGIKNKN